jgi:hypothetical protein
MRIFGLVIILFLKTFSLSAQLLKGMVMDSKTDVPLAGTTIFNLTQRIYKKASFEGQYSIIAMSGDTIIFSSAGYRADTIEVSPELLVSGFNIGLKSLPVVLDTVKVFGADYVGDSLRRREDYAHFYRLPQRSLVDRKGPTGGFGLSFSPITYFSRKEKARRQFRKQLQHIEEQAYVDHYFSQGYVHRLTGLSGEQLYLFMRKYRPSYSFVRSASADDLLRYVNECLKDFRKSSGR